MIDIHEILSILSKQRPIFHSEADFQHAFAWGIHDRLPNASIRLEKPILVDAKSKPLHLDFWAEQDGKAIAIELKYKTRRCHHCIANEQFHLANHSAQDIGRYDFIKDIQRLEQIVSSCQNIKVCGYAIFLTNDSTYWTPAPNGQTIDTAFRLNSGRVLYGTLSWGNQASSGTMHQREQALIIKGKYNLEWREYSRINSEKAEIFCCLVVQVGES